MLDIYGTAVVLYGYVYVQDVSGKLRRYEVEAADSVDELRYIMEQRNGIKPQ